MRFIDNTCALVERALSIYQDLFLITSPPLYPYSEYLLRDGTQSQATGTPATSADWRADFRQLMSRFATGVCVVSVQSNGNSIVAMTVNSFVSVSLEPLLVCWSLQNSASQFDLYANADRFAVSILAEGHAHLARRYAARGDTQLRAEDFVSSAACLPVIEGALAHFECKLHSQHPAGDHTMIFGEVSGLGPAGSLDSASSEAAISPLGFFNGQFCSIGQ